MTLVLALAAALCFVAAAVHGGLGVRKILRPVVAAVPGAFRARTVEAAWHVLTWHFLVMGAVLVVALFRPAAESRLLCLVISASALGYAGIALWIGAHRLGSARRMPQWKVFLPLGLLTGAAPFLGGASLPPVGDVAALVAGTLLAALSALHLVWASGSPWPADTEEELARWVVGTPGRGSMPARAASLVVALGLAVAAAWVLALRGIVFPAPAPGALRDAVSIGLVAVFAARGVAGYVERPLLRPSIAGTPYARWSLRLYSPLAMALALLILAGRS